MSAHDDAINAEADRIYQRANKTAHKASCAYCGNTSRRDVVLLASGTFACHLSKATDCYARSNMRNV
jgi:hypothetical protein